MMGFIKSKISNNTFFWGTFMSVFLIICIIFIIKGVKNYNFSSGDTLFILLFIIMFLFAINYLKQIKYIFINKNQLIYYSILKPFGKKLNLNELIGKIVLNEIGTSGNYRVIYLIDKNNMTVLKIMELHYKNFDVINNMFSFKTIKFHPTALQYFKLLFFERLNITDINNKKADSLNFMHVVKLLSTIGVLLFIIMIIFRFIKNR